MKRLLLILTVSMIFASFSFAQKKNDLRGPQAKNYKLWKDNSEKSVAVSKVTSKRLTGPQAKNKRLRHKSQESAQYTAVTSSNRPKLTGPKAKNWKLMQSDEPSGKADKKIASDEPKREEEKNRKIEIDNDNR